MSDRFLTCREGDYVDLTRGEARGVPERVHVFSEREIKAVNAAIAAKRPLLVLGEPGTGKTQLAEAVARRSSRAFVAAVVDAQTEPRDLLYEVDSVARLGEAQLLGAAHYPVGSPRRRLGRSPDAPGRQGRRPELDIRNFVRPQVLWWAFDWQSACRQAAISGTAIPEQAQPGVEANGVVALIDEIDKAESDIPNALLEALGNARFVPPGAGASVAAIEPGPLVMITTNEERALPNAFTRRCLVLRLRLPEDDELERFLIKRAEAHFRDFVKRRSELAQTLLQSAARCLLEARSRAGDLRPRPGLAEYLDLVRAFLDLFPNAEIGDIEERLSEIREYFLHKAESVKG